MIVPFAVLLDENYLAQNFLINYEKALLEDIE